MSCHGQLPQCRVSVKSWLPGSRISWQVSDVNLWKNSGRSGGAPWLMPIQILCLERRRDGRVEVGRGDTLNGCESGLQREVTKTVNSPGTWFTAVCHSTVPTTAILFPSGLNLSKGIVCVSGLPLITKDSLVVRERERERERVRQRERGLNCCGETVLMLTPLYLRQNNHCQTTAFPLPPPSPTLLVASGGWCVMPSINRKQHFHLPGKQAG